MARKKAAASAVASDPVPTEAARPDVIDEAIANQQTAAAIVQEVADNTRIPEQNGTSFAEKVGKRPPGYTHQGITDSIAGARIHEYHNKDENIYLTIIKFDEKPPREVTSKLREAGFEFSSDNQEWNRPIRFATRQQDRFNADEVFGEVCKLVREAKGVSHSYGGHSAA